MRRERSGNVSGRLDTTRTREEGRAIDARCIELARASLSDDRRSKRHDSRDCKYNDPPAGARPSSAHDRRGLAAKQVHLVDDEVVLGVLVRRDALAKLRDVVHAKPAREVLAPVAGCERAKRKREGASDAAA